MSLLFELEQHQKLVVYEEGNQILAVRLPLRRGGEFRMRDGCLSDLTGVIYRGNIRLAWQSLEHHIIPVSYTHLDVYKRQNDHSVIILCEDHTVTLTDVYKMNGQITRICRQIGLCVLIDALCRLRCSVTDGSNPIISKGITGSTEKQNCCLLYTSYLSLLMM